MDIPIYAIGVGANAPVNDLDRMARLARGRAYAVAAPNEVDGVLGGIQRLLHQGYRLAFRSKSPADNAIHDFSITVSHLGQDVQVHGRFLAVPGLAVTISRVDSATFPRVIVHAAVTAKDGLPVTDLKVGNFRLVEDGIEVPRESFSVVEDDTQNVNLVLAIDVHMPPESLEQVRAAVKGVLGSLGLRDQVAIITFGEEAQLIQNFTGDKGTLRAAVDGLYSQGNRTALKTAVQASVEMASRLPYGRRVVVVLTDGGDEPGGLSAVGARGLELGVPIYAIGIGNTAPLTELEDMANVTRGRAYAVDSPGKVGDGLREIQGLLHRGYTITFRSGRPADDAVHDFSLQTIHQDQQGQTQGRFLAARVAVAVPGITDGQIVAGTLNLTSLVTAPNPDVTVQYALDDQPLAVRDTPPYSLTWDSTQDELGPHVMTIKAVDGDGNEGQATVSLYIAPPLKVAAFATPADITVGELFTVVADVDLSSWADIPLTDAVTATIEVLLDDQRIGQDATSPYSVMLPSAPLSADQYHLTVRAKDNLGRVAETSFPIRFQPAPAPPRFPWERWTLPWEDWTPFWQDWTVRWDVVLVSVIVGGLLVAGLVALLRVFRWAKTRYQQIFQVEILNLGNAPSRYELRAEDSSGRLGFEFFLDGVSLQRRPIAIASAAAMTSGYAVESGGGRETSSAVRTQPTAIGAPEQEQQERLTAARQAAGKAAGATSGLASILNRVARYLPGSAGRSARRVSGQLRRAHAQTRRAQIQTGRASSVAGRISQVQTPDTSRQAAVEPPAQETATPVVTPEMTTDALTTVQTWAQTPPVEPGERMIVDLVVNPGRSFKSQAYPFQLLSRSVEQENAPLVQEEVSVQLVRPVWYRYFLPYLVILIVLLITIGLYLAFLTNAGILG
jgi:VWFA-related protein